MNLNAKERLRGIVRECKNTCRSKHRETFTEFLLEMVKYCSVMVCTNGTHNRPDLSYFGFPSNVKIRRNGKLSAEELTVRLRTCQTHEFVLSTSSMKIFKEDFLVSYLS